MTSATGRHLSPEKRAAVEAALLKNPIATIVAREEGVNKNTVQRIARSMRQRGILGAPLAMTERPKVQAGPAQPKASTLRPKVYLCTAAQDSTAHHDPFWRNLQAYAAYRDAEIIVGGFTYQKGLFEDHAVVANVYDSTIRPYLRPEKVDLAPGLVWCGHANILPTAARPTTGWDTLTGEKWGLIPHAKIRLDSIPVMPGSRPKQVITTGVVTVPNYVQRAAGQKADFHHTIGAAVVEVDPDGSFWVREISAMKDGSFQDLDIVVEGERISPGNRVEAITWGDIHHEKLDPDVAKWSWSIGADCTSMLEALRPRFQFFHDLSDFTPRNHHNRSDPHFRTRMLAEGTDNVEAALKGCADFVLETRRDWCQSIVIESNHDTAFARWLRSPDGREDAENAYFWHRWNANWHEVIRAGDGEVFNVFDAALRALDAEGLRDVIFVPEGHSFTICQAFTPIECGLHGHTGPNGSRGSIQSLARIAPKVNIGHGHSPGIVEGAYMAGISGRLDQGYNTGPTSWAHADIITYPNGKRTIVTKVDGRWRGGL